MQKIPKTALVCSTTDPYKDKRVRRHIQFLVSLNYKVYTCGINNLGYFGDGSNHLRLKINWFTKLFTYICKFLYPLRPYAYNLQLRSQLIAQIKSSDLLVLNDADTLHLLKYKSRSTSLWLDCHEFCPLQYDNDFLWLLFFGSYNKWAFSFYTNHIKVDFFTSVSKEILALYKRQFYSLSSKIDNYLVIENTEENNFRSFDRSKPTRFNHNSPVKLVYHGNLGKRRKLDDLIIAISKSSNQSIFLDIFSTASKAYNDSLKKLIINLKLENRIFVRPPVDYEKLFDQGPRYSFGICLFPPVTTNLFNAAPNKLYIYIQAGLPILTYPSPTIASLVNEFSIGKITRDFSLQSLIELLNELTESDSHRYKATLNKNIDKIYSSLEFTKSYRKIASSLP